MEKIIITNYDNEDVLDEAYKGAKAITPICEENLNKNIFEPKEEDIENTVKKIIDKYIPVIVVGKVRNEIRFVEADKIKNELTYADTISYINLSWNYLEDK